MKKLILVRHAKSSWQTAAQHDFDRPLNDRGHRDAPMMGKRLLAKLPHIDAFVSSTAKRAFTTAAYFVEAYGLAEKQIVSVPELYHAPPSVFQQVIGELNDAWECAVLFAHNPGITDFINELTQVRIDNMPTCAVFAVSIDTDHWKNAIAAEKKFLFFDYPKNV